MVGHTAAIANALRTMTPITSQRACSSHPLAPPSPPDAGRQRAVMTQRKAVA